MDILLRSMGVIVDCDANSLFPRLISYKNSYKRKEEKSTMTSKEKQKPSKSAYADAEATAQNLSKDPGVKTPQASGEAKAVPHYQHKEVTTSIRQEKLVCPQCGKPTLHAEFPDQFEAWVKCSSCDFFMGMSNNDWHRMENSPNINEKIKKMAKKKET